jgi:hypothetical protein
MVELEKEIKREEKKFVKFFSNKANIWMTVSVVLVIALIISLVLPAGAISKSDASNIISAYRTANGATLTPLNVTDKGGVYEVLVYYNGQQFPLYVTKDGKYLGQMSEVKPSSANTNTNTNPKPTEVPKTDKPVVEAFVFSYCPYGLQFEKALLPAYNLLKAKADINIVFIGAMHGEFEKVESLRQLCIQKNYGKDKLWAYLDKFMGNTSIGSCSGSATCLAPLLNPIMSSLSIDKTKIETCMASDAESLYSKDEQRASSLGISGSPTFVINGVEVQVARTPAAIQEAICAAFNNAPSECSQTLSSSAMVAGFGYAAGATSAASC